MNNLLLGLGLSPPSKGGGVPDRALLIGGVPVMIGDYYIVIGA
jgi:hypothetical protein